MSQEQVNVFVDLDLHGAMVLSEDPTDFPANPRPGTLVLKGAAQYAYFKVGDVFTWGPVSSERKVYAHHQEEASATWEITHNLGTASPWVIVYDESGAVVAPVDITAQTPNQTVITLDRMMKGTAVFSVSARIDVQTATASSVNVGGGAVVINDGGILINGNPVLTDGSVSTQITQAVTDAMPTLGSASRLDVAAAGQGDATASQVVLGNDSRLSNARTPLPHDHPGVYAAVGHNHDTDYAAAGHNHDTDYAAVGHNHNSDYAAVGHNHDTDYAAAGHNHDTDYAATGHNHDADYAAVGHDHGTDYAAAGHSHGTDYADATHTHPLATTTTNGLMRATDRRKLDGVTYDIAGAILRKPEAGSCIMIHAAARNLSFEPDFADSKAYTFNRPSQTDQVYVVRVNGVDVGTITFLTTSNTGVLSTNGTAVTCQQGDAISVHAPATVDDALSTACFTLVANYS